jgi:hypothetical protein
MLKFEVRKRNIDLEEKKNIIEINSILWCYSFSLFYN